jgi:hypothetical protein
MWRRRRYGQAQSGLGNLRKRMDVEPGRGQRSIECLGCGRGLAWLIG